MQIWEPLSRQPIGGRFAAHSRGVNLAVAVTAGSLSLLVTTRSHEMRVWDLAAAMLTDRQRPGHTRDVKSALGMRLHGRPVAVTVDERGELRVWDLVTGDDAADPLPVGWQYVKAFPAGEFDICQIVIADGDREEHTRPRGWKRLGVKRISARFGEIMVGFWGEVEG